MKVVPNFILSHWLSVLFVILLVACGGRPTEEMSAAETAIANATLAKKCAPEEYRAAQRMYEKAEAYARAKDYSKAESAAQAARKLAKKAEEKALARKDDCLNAPTPAPVVETTPNSTDLPTRDVNIETMKTVYFGFNAFKLDPEAKTVIDSNVAWLRAHPDQRVEVSGHCDNRGSAEFNLVLGEKRAQSVRQYLIAMGIAKGRIEILSYGEEKLADFEETDASHARNRRAEFLAR